MTVLRDDLYFFFFSYGGLYMGNSGRLDTAMVLKPWEFEHVDRCEVGGTQWTNHGRCGPVDQLVAVKEGLAALFLVLHGHSS